jgi:hypothetical protein
MSCKYYIYDYKEFYDYVWFAMKLLLLLIAHRENKRQPSCGSDQF